MNCTRGVLWVPIVTSNRGTKLCWLLYRKLFHKDISLPRNGYIAFIWLKWECHKNRLFVIFTLQLTHNSNSYEVWSAKNRHSMKTSMTRCKHWYDHRHFVAVPYFVQLCTGSHSKIAFHRFIPVPSYIWFSTHFTSSSGIQLYTSGSPNAQ